MLLNTMRADESFGGGGGGGLRIPPSLVFAEQLSTRSGTASSRSNHQCSDRVLLNRSARQPAEARGQPEGGPDRDGWRPRLVNNDRDMVNTSLVPPHTLIEIHRIS